MIKFENVSKSYNGKTKVVDNLSFTLNPNEIVGFIGPNGAGKTTTLKMLSGILTKDEGNIEINGYNLDQDLMACKKQMGIVMDNPDVFLRLKGIQYLNFIGDIYEVDLKQRQERIERYSKIFELDQVLNDRIISYSHGMRQKIVLVGVLLSDPKLWILDEPLTGLDPQSAYTLKQLMKEHVAAGNTVFFSTHVLEVAQKLCDRIIIIKKGRCLFDGVLEDLQAFHPECDDLESLFLKVVCDE